MTPIPIKRGIQAPSHVTRAQAARILGLSLTYVCNISKPGDPLEAEMHWGTAMIPVWRILRLQDERDEKAPHDRRIRRKQ